MARFVACLVVAGTKHHHKVSCHNGGPIVPVSYPKRHASHCLFPSTTEHGRQSGSLELLWGILESISRPRHQMLMMMVADDDDDDSGGRSDSEGTANCQPSTGSGCDDVRLWKGKKGGSERTVKINIMRATSALARARKSSVPRSKRQEHCVSTRRGMIDVDLKRKYEFLHTANLTPPRDHAGTFPGQPASIASRNSTDGHAIKCAYMPCAWVASSPCRS
ncbi:hypothetical protein F5148DRAFT_318289 [Russula earlei]|uniref:Uncharacterized protein n=1 Tax=Russula earlei TaxID=71964 RepID=A0ACC0U1Z5_9AGAM|nr:hypothetical protein F5148DRAFT_318289 [Russula earlei]